MNWILYVSLYHELDFIPVSPINILECVRIEREYSLGMIGRDYHRWLGKRCLRIWGSCKNKSKGKRCILEVCVSWGHIDCAAILNKFNLKY